jgi:tetratricopeptide (TPR) repeat protein
VDLGGLMIRMVEDPRIGLDHYDGDQLFALGLEAFGTDRFDVASYLFSHLIEVFPAHSDRVPTTWNLGLSLEKIGRIGEAISIFGDYLELVATMDGEEAAQARLRIATLLQREGRYEDILPLLDAPSAFVDYAEYEVWELRALRAIAKGADGKFAWAEGELNRLRLEIKRSTRKTGDRYPYQAAMVWYLAGTLDRLQAGAIPLDSVDDIEQLDKDIGAKADLLFMARRRLKRAIEHGEPTWSGPAAFALGAVYRDFRQDMLDAPVPQGLSAEQFAVYERLVRQRTTDFLTAAIKDYRAILDAAPGWRLETPWVEAIEEALKSSEEELAAGGLADEG